MAAEMQTSILPEIHPTIPGFDIAAAISLTRISAVTFTVSCPGMDRWAWS